MIVTLTKEEYIKDIVRTAKNIGKDRAIEIIRNIASSGEDKWFGVHAGELIEAIQAEVDF